MLVTNQRMMLVITIVGLARVLIIVQLIGNGGEELQTFQSDPSSQVD